MNQLILLLNYQCLVKKFMIFSVNHIVSSSIIIFFDKNTAQIDNAFYKIIAYYDKIYLIKKGVINEEILIKILLFEIIEYNIYSFIYIVFCNV